jgi:hypothetical protein
MSKPITPTEYITSLPDDRRMVIEKIRETLLNNLPAGFEETIAYGMLGFVVPHTLYPKGYHADPKQPLPFIALGNQKNYISLYHMALYADNESWFLTEWPKHSSQKADIGKCCIRMKKLDAIPYELIGQLAQKFTPQQWIQQYEASLKK